MKKSTGKYVNTTILSFPDFETLGRVISPARLELLFVIRRKSPRSIQELARMANRDFKNVYADVQALAQYGLIELKTRGRGKASAPEALFQELIFAAYAILARFRTISSPERRGLKCAPRAAIQKLS